MSVFLLLVRKELRDQRALLFASCVLAPVLSALIAWAFRDSTTPDIAGQWVLPGILLFFLAALATELATRDVGNAVGDTLARLPVPRRLHWAAKIAACACAGTVFTLWFVASEWAWRSLAGWQAREVLHELSGARPQHAGVLVATTAAFAFASVTRKGFASAGLAIALVIGVGYALFGAQGSVRGLAVLAAMDLWPRGWWPCSSGIALALASGLAFDPRVPRAGDALRRTGLFLSSLVGALGSLGIAAHWRFRDACRVDPRAANTFVYDFEISPNGRWVAMELRRWLTHGFDFQQIWVLDLQRDELFEIPVDGAELFPTSTTSAWLDDSLFRLTTLGGPGQLWDARDGELASAAQLAAVVDSQSRIGWCPRGQSAGQGLYVEWPDRGVAFHSSDGEWGARSPEPGVFFYFDVRGALHRHDLTSGDDRLLHEGFHPEHLGLLRVDCDAKHVLVEDRVADRVIYLDARTGEILAEFAGEWRHRQWTGLDEPWVVLQARSEHGEFPRSPVRFLGSDASWDVTFDGLSHLQVLPDDRLLYSPGPVRLELRDYHGALIRTLFPLPDDVSVRRASSASNP